MFPAPILVGCRQHLTQIVRSFAATGGLLQTGPSRANPSILHHSRHLILEIILSSNPITYQSEVAGNPLSTLSSSVPAFSPIARLRRQGGEYKRLLRAGLAMCVLPIRLPLL